MDEAIRTTLSYKRRTVEMKDENTAKAMEVVGRPKQMELAFERPFSDIVIREAIRSTKTIMRELVRLGFGGDAIKGVMELLGKGNPVITEAFAVIDEQIEKSAQN